MKQNKIYVVDTFNLDAEIAKLQLNLDTFLKLETSFEKICGTKEFKTLEVLDAYIISKSGFPNIEASVDLMDMRTPYDYIKKFLDSVVLECLDTEKRIIHPQVIAEVTEIFSYRLNDNADSDYKVLLEITKMYAKLKNPASIHAIETYDSKEYTCNLQRLNQLNSPY